MRNFRRTGWPGRVAAGTAALLLTAACAVLPFALTAEAAAGYKPVTKKMKVVMVGTSRDTDILGMNSLNMNEKYFYGSFSLSRDGTVSVAVPRIEGVTVMKVTGEGTSHIYTMHKADGVMLTGNMENRKHSDAINMGGYSRGASEVIPADSASSGIYEVWQDIGAEYAEAEKKSASGIQEESIVDTLNAHPEDKDSMVWYHLTGEGSISLSNTSTQLEGKVFQVTLTLPTSGMEVFQYGRQVQKESGGTPAVRIMMSCKGHVDLSGSASGLDTPVIEHVFTPGGDNPGEFDGGVPIPLTIMIGLTGAMVLSALKSLEDETGASYEDEMNKFHDGSKYWMRLNKQFGDKLKKGEEPKPVYARIVQVKPSGEEIDRPDLTAQIQVSSHDDSLVVTDGGMSSNGYRTAMVSVPEQSKEPEGMVTFLFSGEGGDFYQHVIFRLQEAEIIFTRDNMGLPANYLKFAREDSEKKAGLATEKPISGYGDGEFRLPFLVKDMDPEKVRVSAELVKAGVTDVREGRVEVGEHGMPYSVEIRGDKEYKKQGIYEAVIREVLNYELPAGTTEGILMKIKAECGTPGGKDYESVEGMFSLYRIHMGLALEIATNSIPCYMQLKEGVSERKRQGSRADSAKAEEITVDDIEPCYGEGSVILFLCNKSDLEIMRIAVVPEQELKVKAKRLANDRYCHIGDATKDHQKLVDALGIKVFATNQFLSGGVRKLLFCSTTGALDPPTRLVAEVELTVKYEEKVYTIKKDVLLRSQPFRIGETVEESMHYISEDEHLTEALMRIRAKIYDRYMDRLFSLYDLIGRMVDGYDSRFGYDANQIYNVKRVWIGFVEGSHMGARGEAEVVTLADDIAACYAFVQGLRDNTGILGRIAMGVMTAGYSEYLFTAMTLAEEMRAEIFKCRGDKDFGFWDGVIMGVKEFEKQILIEYAIKGGLQSANILVKARTNIDMGQKLTNMAGRYRTVMDNADEFMKGHFEAYKAADKAFQSAKDFFNSSAAAAKNYIENTFRQLDDAGRQADDIIDGARKKMTPAERAKALENDAAMEEGMNKVRELQKAQQEMEAATTLEKQKAAQKKYRKAADEVWTDKNALKQLQVNQHPYAQRMRAQFNHYRENLLDDVQRKAMNDLAKEMGLPPDNLYCCNASGGSKIDYKTGKKVPADRDITINQKVLSDRSKDFAISQSDGERAIARRLFKEMNGLEPASLKEALDFMKAKDVTYVAPQGDSFKSYVIEMNPEAYADLGGMIGLRTDGVMDKSLLKNDLKGLALNRNSMAHKGKEWFNTSKESLEQALRLEQKAASLTGTAKEAALAEAKTLRYYSNGQLVEGVRQITKQVNNIVIPRSVARNGINIMPRDAMKLHQIALRVGKDVQPVLFEKILRENFGMSLYQYADYMSKFLN